MYIQYDFIVQICAKVPTKKENKSIKDMFVLTKKKDEAFYFFDSF
jgi:hypothetical protein